MKPMRSIQMPSWQEELCSACLRSSLLQAVQVSFLFAVYLVHFHTIKDSIVGTYQICNETYSRR